MADKRQFLFSPYYKELLLERDYEYFLNKNIEANDYSKEDLATLRTSYRNEIRRLKSEINSNRKQTHNYLLGEVILMFDGGLLPSHFRLDGFTRSFNIFNGKFQDYGINWAKFETWQKYELKKRRPQHYWNWFIKIGSIAGIVLALIKLFETFLNE